MADREMVEMVRGRGEMEGKKRCSGGMWRGTGPAFVETRRPTHPSPARTQRASLSPAQEADSILEGAKEGGDVSFLVVGDPFG